jgi:FlaA1/EpsC-like NDP-sugar epimerase
MSSRSFDGVAWLVAVPIAILLRYDFEPPSSALVASLVVGLICGFAYTALATVTRISKGRYRAGSIDEAIGIVFVCAAIGILGLVVQLTIPATSFPRSTIVLSAGIAAAGILASRIFWRQKLRRSALKREGVRTLIYGAGNAGLQIAALTQAEVSSDTQLIGFIDDDINKKSLRLAGLKVLGSLDDLESLVYRFKVDVLLVAIAGIHSEQLLELDQRCGAISVKLRIIPTSSEIVGGAVKLGDVSDVTYEDLLGRRPIDTDEEQIRRFLAGRRILITGAGGSIGSELVRQVSRYSPEVVYLLDRDESSLHATQLSLDGSGTLESNSLVLADIRDLERMHEVFGSCRPGVVFHAAALKHLPLLEKHPEEAFKTNVVGTLNVLQAALDNGATVFINVSTDKAADPTSVLGFSKLLTERVTSFHAGEFPEARCLSVRFGNVLGSRGSVIDTFRHQIQKGGPVTVTDERVTRYFMTVREAVHLVLQASVIGESGETLILDMGQPKRILDLARQMISRSGRDIEIRFTGLRPGEKLDEVLVAQDEAAVRPHHPLVSHTIVQPLSSAHIPAKLESGDMRTELMILTRLGDRSSERDCL